MAFDMSKRLFWAPLLTNIGNMPLLCYNVFMNAIEVKNLKKHFGKIKAIDGIDFSVEKGEIYGFLGPNGAGKTTTIRCLMDFIRPTEGSITILGKDAQKHSVELNKKIGYLSGQVHLYDKWTGQQHIDFIKATNGTEDIAEKLIKRFDFDPAMKTKKLSSGNRQKLGIIMAFMTKLELLICDEPTNALDPLLQHEVYELLKEARDGGATVFMSSHNLPEVEKVCSNVAIIKKGKMVATESILTLREKKLYSVKVFFKEKINIKDLEFDGVSVEKQLSGGYLLNVKGDINRLVSILCNHPLKDLEIERANLEDIFLEFYQ